MTQLDPDLLSMIGEDTETVDYNDVIGDEESTQPVLGKTSVELPGGVLTEQGVVRTVTVKELTGYDEEELARADIKQPIDYLSKMLKIGIKEIGGKPPNAMVLEQLLIGDRNTIIIGIRIATFGNEIEMRELKCPECEKDFDLVIGLDEFESKTLKDPVEDRTFEVKLSRKRKAKVRLATHGDIAAAVKKSPKPVEQNNVMLANCIIDIDGEPLALMSDDPEETVRALNMRDRQLILDTMSERQPGPDLTGVKIACPSCDFEDRIGIDLLGLFRI